MPITVGQPLTRTGAGRVDVPRTPWAALGALLVLAAALRFSTLTTQSIWFDEAATWDLVRLPFGAMLNRVAHHESSPPLFYALAWLWTHVAGTRAEGLRSLPALAGTLTVPVAYGIGVQVAGRRPSPPQPPRDAGAARRAGLAVAALVAVNPLLVWFSQEARAYALVVLLSAASLLLFLRCLDDERPRVLAAWAVVSALALATHYFAAFVLAPQAAWLLWRHPQRRAARTAVAGLVVVGAALLPLLLAQRANPYEIAGSSLAVRLAQVPKQFLLGYRGPLGMALGLVEAALLVGGAWLLVRHTERTVRERALCVVAIGVIGIVLPLAAALAGADYLNARNALPALVPLLGALGVAYGASRPTWAGATLLGGVCAISLAIVVAVATDQRYQRPDWSGLAHALGRSDGARAIVIAPATGEAPLRFYRSGLATMAPGGGTVPEVDVVAVASPTGPGAVPTLPGTANVAARLAGFHAVQRLVTPRYELLRLRSAAPVHVTPEALAAVRFGAAPAAVSVLPAGR